MTPPSDAPEPLPVEELARTAPGISLEPFFTPKSVAVVGVSPSERNLGRNIVQNLVEFGFAGAIVPVGPRGGQVLGRTIVPSVTAAGVPVDLAVILVPVGEVLPAIEDCGRAGVRAVVISTGGFSEYEEDRAGLEQEALTLARRHGFRIIGPNCIGVIHLPSGLCVPFPPQRRADYPAGDVSLVSQSGGVMLHLAARLAEERLGVRTLVSEGNKLDVDEADLVPVLAADPGTRVVTLYLESITRGRALAEAASRCEKPVIALKANTAPESAGIARSHTAALANDDRVVDAAFRQAGVVRVQSIEELLVAAKAFRLPPLRGDRVVVACMSGGISVVAADACARYGLRLPELPPGLLDDVEGRGRGRVIHLGNPMDLGDIHDASLMLLALERGLGLPEVDGAAFCMPPAASAAQLLGGLEALAMMVGKVEALERRYGKPVALSVFGGRRAAEAMLERTGRPVFWTVEESLQALAIQRAWWGRGRPGILPMDPEPGVRPAPDWPEPPSPVEALQFLAGLGLPVQEMALARSPEEAVAAAERLGFPVALKLVSREILHKTDVGGVALGLRDAGEVAAAFKAIMAAAGQRAPGAVIDGAGVQRMAPPGHEVIVGARRDPAFGPVVLAGLGGIWTEALGDVALRLAPVRHEEACRMLAELRGHALLRGLRGRPPADEAALAGVLAAVSRLVVDIPAIRELDLNPVIAGPWGARVVDARIVPESGAARSPFRERTG
jgi:acetyltransferase